MPRAATPGPALADLNGRLRAAWIATAESSSAGADLAAFLELRLDELEMRGLLDETSLSGVIDEVEGRLHGAGRDDMAPQIVRRLLRCVYDFVVAKEPRPLVGAPPRAAAGAEPRDEHSADRDAVEVHVRGGHLDKAAAALTALANRGAGRQVVPVALDAGDRCAAAGLPRAASDCYAAAWAADRLDERSLWRLASLAVEDGDVELAVSYLRRIVALLQWRGDVRGVMRVYRKMSMLVPGGWQIAVPALPSWPQQGQN